MKVLSNRYFFMLYGLILGSIITGMILSQFISSQRNQGRNEGALSAKREVFEFLKGNVKNSLYNKKVVKNDIHYSFKYYRISVIEIDGVQTIQLTE